MSTPPPIMASRHPPATPMGGVLQQQQLRHGHESCKPLLCSVGSTQHVLSAGGGESRGTAQLVGEWSMAAATAACTSSCSQSRTRRPSAMAMLGSAAEIKGKEQARATHAAQSCPPEVAR